MATTNRSQSSQQIPLDRLGGMKFYFGMGSSQKQFEEQGLEFFNKIDKNDARSKYHSKTGSHGQNIFFSGTTTWEELKKEITTYINMPLVLEAIDGFDGVLETIEMGGAFNKNRLKATSNPQGIFDFSLASQGLIRPVEYFSKELSEDLPNLFYSQYTINGKVLSGLVPPDLVYKIKGVNGNVYFYTHKKDGKDYDYLCQQRQVGVTEALFKSPNLKVKMFGEMEILAEYNKDVVFRSTNKKCYLMYDKKGGKANKVELYVIQGGSGGATAEGMLLKIMPVLLAAKTLEEAGIKTRIYAVRAYSDGRKYVFMSYPIKEYGEQLDWNKIALNVADPRIFRFKTWRAITGWLDNVYGNIGASANKGYGSTLTDSDEVRETFERYKNWSKEQQAQGKNNQKEVSRQLQLIGGISDPEYLQDLWNTDRDKAKELITDEFYRIMDTLDIQLSVMSTSANRITKRLQDKGYNIRYIKKYINELITSAYTIPTSGDYATDPASIQKIVEKQQQVFDAYFEWSS